MLGDLFPTIRKTMQLDLEENEQHNESFYNQKTTRDPQLPSESEIPQLVHRVGKEDPIDQKIEQDIKAIFNTTMLKSKKTYSKQYIPLGSIVDNSYLKQHEIKDLHFEHISLNSVNQSSLQKVVFKHNEQTRQIRFYIPTFLRFSLIKLHSQDLKNITHIQNKNNLIIYINVYTKGLPKMLIDKLTKRTKGKNGDEEAKLLFRANRHLFEAKYYTSYNDYLIFMFNPFSENMIQFEIMKNVMFAPFEQAELILHIRINKKVFKLQRSKTLKIAKSSKIPSFKQQSPYHKKSAFLSPSINHDISEQSSSQDSEQDFDILHFNKIIMEFKLQKPKDVVDSFRFHKSIQFGNYGIMTHEINIHIGSYQSPEKKKQLEQERAQLNIDQEEIHQDQLEDISSMRLSIGLYKHPVTQLCTFFIPLMLAGGLTLLLFHLCDHSLTNELQVLAIILVAYGAFIPQFRQRISMSRTVIFVDIYILYNMIPAILCAFQSIAESRHKKTYNIYQVVSVIMYYASILFLVQVYILYLYVDKVCFKKHTKQMVHNFDTDIFQTQEFQDQAHKCLSWFVLKSQQQRAFFCERQQPVEKPKKSRFTRKQTRYSSRLQQELQQAVKRHEAEQLAESVALQIRMSATTSKTLGEVKESEEEELQQKHQQHQFMYKTKVIENERHIHSFEKILTIKEIILGILVIMMIMSTTVWVSWTKIYEILTFQDLNKNCIHDEDEAQRLSRVESIISKEETLSKLISQNWNDASVPVPDVTYDQFGHRLHKMSHQNENSEQQSSSNVEKKQKSKHQNPQRTNSLHHFQLRHNVNSKRQSD